MSVFGVTRRGAIQALAASAVASYGVKGAPRKAISLRRAYSPSSHGQLHYRFVRPVTTTRPPLFCFHSSPNSGRIYDRFLVEIGQDRMSVAPDTPGFGDSDPPPEQPSIDDYAKSMFDFIEQFDAGPVDVMGYHTGSKIAVALASAHPEKIRRLILVSAPVYTPQELERQTNHFGPTVLSTDGSHLTEIWLAHVKWAMPGWTIDDVAVQFPDAVRRPDVSWWGHHAAFNYDMGANLPDLVQPVLILNPEDDLHQQTVRAEALLNRGRYLPLRGWGHGFLDLHSAEAASYVRSFLDESA